MTNFFAVGDKIDLVSEPLRVYNRDIAAFASAKGTLDCIGAFSRTDFRGDLASFTVPTLVIHGDKDRLVPPSGGRATALQIGPAPKTPSGYADFLPELEKEVVGYGKPVLLLHGDTHYFRVDKPLFRSGVFGGGDRGRQIENFTRVEVHVFPEAHWVRITVDPSHASVFSVREEVVDANRFR